MGMWKKITIKGLFDLFCAVLQPRILRAAFLLFFLEAVRVDAC